MAHVSGALRELPERLGMRRLIPPYAIEVASNNRKDPGGLSGFVIIQDSHISVRAFPARRFVSIDVYSCRDFNTAQVCRYFQRAFNIRKCETNLIIRGKEYPLADLV